MKHKKILQLLKTERNIKQNLTVAKALPTETNIERKLVRKKTII
jgi:hypothetical protein